MKFDVCWATQARAALRNIDRESAMRILSALTDYARSGTGDVAPLHGPLLGSFRLRVGPWRVCFKPLHDAILVFQVQKRGDAYR